jgi:hypothetical protein
MIFQNILGLGVKLIGGVIDLFQVPCIRGTAYALRQVPTADFARGRGVPWLSSLWVGRQAHGH